MTKKVTFLELAALCLVLLLMTTAAAEKRSDELAESLIRLHVVANSDTDGDQALKLRVRDSVLAAMAGVITPGMDQAEAARAISDSMPAIQAAAVEAAEGQHIAVTLTQEYYPTREYDSFSLPAGEYMSLRVLIGEAAGRNWWCVVFPPLCTELCIEEADAVWGLSDEDMALITGDGGYVIRFRIIEWWEELKAAYGG